MRARDVADQTVTAGPATADVTVVGETSELPDLAISKSAEPLPSPLTPEDIPLRILHEDADLVVLDKPAGLVVHPAPGHPGLPEGSGVDADERKPNPVPPEGGDDHSSRNGIAPVL